MQTTAPQMVDWPNPVNDARSLSQRLRELGYTVIYKKNLATREAMETAVEDFSSQISDADVALFYYSGHGVQRQGKNYLMPTQAKINKARQIRHRAMNISFLMDEMSVNTRGLSLVILDACRDDPYPRDSKSSSSRGLARMDAPSGTIIAYATKPGSTAADGIGNHSPYTAQLLTHLQTQGHQPIGDVLNRVNVAVEDATNRRQSPRLEMSPLRFVYCFAECASRAQFQSTTAATTAIAIPVSEPEQSNLIVDSFTGMKLVKINAGCFQMGSPESEAGREDNERQHQVCIDKDYYLGQYEVTQAQWQKVMSNNPSSYKGNNKPVGSVSWIAIQDFISKLNQQTGLSYRLPTEAEWEYAAKAGTDTPFYTGKCINTNQANYNGNHDYNACGAKTGLYRKQTIDSGQFLANHWSLYDMAGNVWEWTCSEYDAEYSGGENKCLDKININDDSLFVLRGGSFDSLPRWLRSAYRLRSGPWRGFGNRGFRLARTF